MAYTKKQSYQPTKIKEDVLEILEKRIAQFLSSDKWKQYLTFQATFHDYSFNNCISILAQRPNATYVAGFEGWKKGFNRYVKKGEKVITILMPVFKKVKEEEEREDQKPNRTLVCFRIGYVCDYAQTDGDPLPEFSFAKRLEFNSDLNEKMRAACPFPIREADDCGGANGYFSYSDHSITILSSMSTAHKARCIIHEYAHGLLHDPKDKSEGSRPQRSIRELEATSVSFIVSQSFGLDTSDYAFGYISAGVYDLYSKLYAYGHELDPHAPIKLSGGFTPPVIGQNQLANFHTSSYFLTGSYLIILGGLIGVWVLWKIVRKQRPIA